MLNSLSNILILCVAALSVLFAGCSKMSLVMEPVYQGKGIAMLSLVAAANSPFHTIARKATLTISASDMLTMSRNLSITDSSVTGIVTGIPAGINRLFVVAIYDSLDTLQYLGSTTAWVIADSTVIVPINVIRIARQTSPSMMKYIAGGTFQMGLAGTSDTVHQVTVSSFYMDSTEVTQGDYMGLMGGVNPAVFSGNSRWPILTVSWYDAVLYCNLRSKRDGRDTVYSYTSKTQMVSGTGATVTTGLAGITTTFTKNGYRLPTEAEWEYACRAGTTTKYYWGNDSTPTTASLYTWNYSNSSNNPGQVATKLPNAWGLYDMLGNAFEWCSDWYGGNFGSAAATDPRGPATGSYRIRRSGTWSSGAAVILGSATRNYLAAPDNIYINDQGFRCVCGAL